MDVEVRTVQPVMGVDERDAAVVTLRAVLLGQLLVEFDEDRVRGAIEAMQDAPDGPKVASAPAANALGPFQRDSAESREAALRNYPRSGTQRAAVLERICRRGEQGATRDELCQWLGLEVSSINPRVWGLVKSGLVITKLADDGKPVTRRTRSGNRAAVLVASRRALSERSRRQPK